MSTNTPGPSTKPLLDGVLERVNLPLVGERALKMIVVLLGEDDLGPVLRATDAANARDELAKVARVWIEEAERSRFILNAGAVLLVVLALAHELVVGAELVGLELKGAAAAPAAAVMTPWLLEPDRRSLLLCGVASLVEDLHEGIALDEGRGTLIRALRNILDKVARLDPLALDVSSGRILFGGKPVAFRRKGERPAGCVAENRFLRTTNNEGKLILLCASGRPPRGASRSVISHVRAALEAMGGRLRLDSDLKLAPQPRLTRRAERAAARIRWSGMAQVRSVS